MIILFQHRKLQE